jgi:hypothetical protein
MLSAFHPQSDGQSEAPNNIIAMYLRCLPGDWPRQWLQWFSWTEFFYNSAHQASLRTSPFRVVYGRDPPSVRSYALGDAKLLAVHHRLLVLDEFLAEIWFRLEQVQQRYKFFYDERHWDLTFDVGQWVWLYLIHRPTVSLDITNRDKLGPKFYGLF